jgi:predicted amidophosphoribosyltransferase
MSKTVKKLEIHLREEAIEDYIFGCPLCNEEVGFEDNYCPECGAEFENDE